MGLLAGCLAKASASFLKKRSKKLLFTAGCGDSSASRTRSKSFLVLFFKKERLSYLSN
jgi:hypothetical protein